MQFIEETDLFLTDFAQKVFFEDGEFFAIFNTPDQILSGDMIVSTDYTLQAKTVDIVKINVGSILQLEINGERKDFEVRQKIMTDDGVFSEVAMSLT
tara:strand:- start:2750 stop:3040 length:291 start_codon:yes stop_codon:yes gene_type:complete